MLDSEAGHRSAALPRSAAFIERPPGCHSEHEVDALVHELLDIQEQQPSVLADDLLETLLRG
jgi:hypothetical protein